MGLRGLEGNMQAQPRIFAHDAVILTVGAINTTSTDAAFSFAGGTGFVAGDVGATMTAATGSATFKITSVNAGAITGLDLLTAGSGYSLSTPVNLTGGTGSGASFTPTNLNIPNTEERGCCVYVGAGGDMTVIMESGSTAVEFKGLSSGTFLPILINRVVSSTAADLVALY